MVEQNYFSTQGTIAPSRRTSIAQGTIEYLVIIAIVVVISLVVVALLLGIFENNSGQITGQSQQLNLTTQPLAVKSSLIGTGEDANGLLVISNNTGSRIQNPIITLGNKQHEYYGVIIGQGDTRTLKLNAIETSCGFGETKTIQELKIIYTTKDGLTQTINYGTVALDCTEETNPTPTKPPQEEKQEEVQEPTDIEGPIISIESPGNETTFSIGDEIQFEYLASDTSVVQDCNLIINDNSEDYSASIDEENLNYFIYPTAELTTGEYTMNIFCKDTLGNTNTATEITFTLQEPIPDLAIVLSNEDIQGTNSEAAYDIDFTANKNATCKLSINSTEYGEGDEVQPIEVTADQTATFQTNVTHGVYDYYGDYNYHWNYTISCETETEEAQATGTLTTNYRRIHFLRTGLIGYWPLEDNVNNYSGSGKYNLTYSTPSYINGIVEKGISTPGTNNLTYYPYRSSDDSLFDVFSSESLTVCAWAKKTTTINDEAIVAKEDQSSPYNGWVLWLMPSNECGPVTNAIGLNLIDGSNRRLVRATIAFPQGEWQHVCGVIDRTTQQISIYQQGNNVTYTGGTTYCSRSLTGVGELNALRGLGIGVRDPNYIHNKFTGEIDEPTIWQRALSEEEIKALYNEGKGLSLIQ